MLTTTRPLQDARTKNKLEPNLVLEIDGYDKTFSIRNIKTRIRIGDPGLKIGDDWVIGGLRGDYDDFELISLDGSTTSIGQQLNPDKGGASSVSNVQISLIDPSSIVSALISPGFELEEILGRKAWVYLGFDDVNIEFPNDYPILFSGIIDDVTSDSKITITVSHPEQKKRQELFPHVEVNLAQTLLVGGTTIFLESVDEILSPVSPEFLTYVKVNDEIISYAAVDTGASSLTGCVRAQFGTIADQHEVDDPVSTFYRLSGNAVDLALKLYMSSSEPYFAENRPVESFDASDNTMFFDQLDMVAKYGVLVGDFVTTTGATNGANNASLSEITDVEVTESGTFITVTGPTFVDESDSPAVAAFKSQYNVLPDGLGMAGDEVDIDEFRRITTIYNAQFHDYDFYLTETLEGKDFIDKEILYPSNLYSIPRRGKVSVGVVGPPLAVATLPVLDANAILNPEQMKVRRNLNKYLYNTVVARYDFDAIETDTPLAGYIRRDEDSINRFNRLRKTYNVTARGLRRSSETDIILDINARRVLDRYSKGAEYFQCDVAYGIGFTIDVGDVVLFGDLDLPIVDTSRGTRGFSPRLCEVIDRKLDIKGAKCSVTMVDTKYQLNGRYGIVHPASEIDSGATSTVIPILPSFSYEQAEPEKWIPFIGEQIMVHDNEWTSVEETKLLDVSGDNLIVSGLVTPPSAGWFVDVPQYPSSTNPNVNFKYKNIFVFGNPKLDVVSGASTVAFDVSVSDAAKVVVGATVLVHNPDFSVMSPEVEVIDKTGTTITVSESLGFTPSSTDDVVLVGFLDGGAAYRYL